MPLPTVIVQNIANCGIRRADFVVAVVKMGRDSNPGLRTVIGHNIPCDEFPRNFISVFRLQRDGSGPQHWLVTMLIQWDATS